MPIDRPSAAAPDSASIPPDRVKRSLAHSVRDGLKQGLFRSVLTALSRATVPSAAPAVRNCLELADETLNAYFTLFTEKYPSSLSARGWVDAASGFLADFKQLVRDLPE